jgi:hypothetical protein
MQRDNAKGVFASINMQVKIDRIKGSQITGFGFDTCNTMFGCNAGVAVLLSSEYPHAICQKCVPHLSALGDKHGIENHSAVHRLCDKLMQLGRCAAASSRFHVLLGEANELLGTLTKPIGEMAATRWG